MSAGPEAGSQVFVCDPSFSLFHQFISKECIHGLVGLLDRASQKCRQPGKHGARIANVSERKITFIRDFTLKSSFSSKRS